MISRRKSREHRPARPLSNWAIVQGAVIVFGISAVAWTVLLWRYAGTGPGVELDAVRAAGALTVAAGGAAALLLATRRQIHTERDSSEQRITELYTRAVDQLGAEKAPVRLGGLHALERLAQNNPVQRQTIVDVICAYLRMPYTPPDDQPPNGDASEDAHRRYEQRRQELQVRRTAQRILAAHVQPEMEAAFWDGIDLNLADAYLHKLDLIGCHLRSARFDRATFAGHAKFDWAEFAGTAEFYGAEFVRTAELAGTAGFVGTNFAGTVGFRGTKFTGCAWFGDAKFGGDVKFSGTRFTGGVEFNGTEFAENPDYNGAHVAPSSSRAVLPRGWTTRAAQPAAGEEEGWLYVVRDEESSEQPTEATDGSSDQV